MNKQEYIAKALWAIEQGNRAMSLAAGMVENNNDDLSAIATQTAQASFTLANVYATLALSAE